MKKVLIQLIVPHERSKRTRAHTISHEALFLYATFVFLVQFSISFVSGRFPGILGFSSNIKVEEIIEETNLERSRNNLPSLKINESLTKAAQLKASYMFEKDFWAHIAPDGATPWKFILDSGYRYLYAGENLAKDFQNTNDVVDAWMNSKMGHRENLLGGNYTDIGVAVVNGTLGGFETTLVVQMFGSTKAAEAGPGVAQAKAPEVQKSVVSETPQVEEKPVEVLEKLESQKPNLAPGVGSPLTQVSLLPLVSKPFIPVIDVISLVKSVSFSLGFFLLALFIIDGLVVFRKGIVRVSGHNGAHILVLLMILSSTLFLSAGSIR